MDMGSLWHAFAQLGRGRQHVLFYNQHLAENVGENLGGHKASHTGPDDNGTVLR
jgi:hypothetical protein